MTRARQAAGGLALAIAVAGCGSSAERSAAPQFGQVHAEPFPQAGMARLGHGDDAADLPAGDPAAIGQAFVVLTAIIGLLTAGYAASLRRGRPASGM